MERVSFRVVRFRLVGDFTLDSIHTLIIRVWLHFTNNTIRSLDFNYFCFTLEFYALEDDDVELLFFDEFKSIEGVKWGACEYVI